MTKRKKPSQVWNITRDTQLVSCLEMADNYFARLKGLMFRPGLPEGAGLWIVPCKDIHSCFMRFEFDAVFVDKANRVVYLVERMRPWGMTKFIKEARAVLELPPGVIAATATQLGDQLELREAFL